MDSVLAAREVASKGVLELFELVPFTRAVVPPDSPKNILGSRWMGISEPGYGIHGTRDPDSIGQAVTAGCVRMLNEDVEELYAIVPIGTEIAIIN